MSGKSVRFVGRGAAAAVAAAVAVCTFFGVAGIVAAAPPTTTIGTSITTTGTISGDGSLLTNLSKAQVGLGNVDNLQQMPLSYLDADPTLAANSDTKVATQKATKKYVDDADVLKADKVTSATNGHFAGLNASGNLTDSGYAFSSFLASSGDGSLLTGLTKTQVGLGNVPNVDATNPANITQDSTHRFVSDTEKTTWNGKLNLSGGTMTGALVLSGDPSASLGAATKKYVDDADGLKADKVSSATSGHFASLDSSGNLVDSGRAAPSGTIVGTTDVQTLSFKDMIDSSLNFVDDGDSSKKLAFQLSGISTATKRTLTIPDASGTILLSNSALSGGALSLHSVLADRLQNAPTDLGGADVGIDLSNSNGGFVTNLSLDGRVSASSVLALRVMAEDGASMLRFDSTALSSDYFTLTNSNADTPITLGADGTDANVSIRLLPKGAGSVVVGGDALRMPIHSVDPSGTAGMVYFNSVAGKLRCYASAWGECGTSVTNAVSRGGDTLGADLSIGTNDAFALNLRTNGVSRLSIDASGKVLIAGGLDASGVSSFKGDVVLGSASTTAHLLALQNKTPTISDDGNVGVSSLQAGSTDVAGQLTSTADRHTFVVLLFGTAYANPPFCVISAADANAASHALTTYVTTTASTMTISSVGFSSLAETYTYHCVGNGSAAAIPQ